MLWKALALSVSPKRKSPKSLLGKKKKKSKIKTCAPLTVSHLQAKHPLSPDCPSSQDYSFTGLKDLSCPHTIWHPLPWHWHKCSSDVSLGSPAILWKTTDETPYATYRLCCFLSLKLSVHFSLPPCICSLLGCCSPAPPLPVEFLEVF